jgi:hypothetical protein
MKKNKIKKQLDTKNNKLIEKRTQMIEPSFFALLVILELENLINILVEFE